MKKRALALCIAICTAVSAFAAPVFAADFSWEAQASRTSLQVGETFELDFDITESPGINNATITIEYNSRVVVPTETAEQAEDIMCYTSNNGYDMPLFDVNYVNGIVNKASANGELVIANLVMEADEENNLKEVTTTGTLARITFKAVGEGSADLRLSTPCIIKRTSKKADGNLAYSINLPKVTVSAGGSDAATETTTAAATTAAATTATTTKAASDDDDDDDDSVVVKRTTTTTTTTATTTTESSSETTTAENSSDTEASTNQQYATATEPEAVTFTDLGNYPWAAGYINELAADNIVSGYGNGLFKPGDNVKRADFIIMLLRAMGINTSSIAKPASNFSDVSSDKYYYNAVGLAKEIGLASGNPDGTFNPESNITRQDMMILAKKAVEIKTETELTGDTAVLDRFADKGNISSYAAEGLAAMVEAEVVSGSDGKILPKDNTTRAQAAVIIYKIRELMR